MAVKAARISVTTIRSSDRGDVPFIDFIPGDINYED
jgi:hypothetical protein